MLNYDNLRQFCAKSARTAADWFNNRRLLEPIGHVPPAEFEEA